MCFLTDVWIWSLACSLEENDFKENQGNADGVNEPQSEYDVIFFS